MAKKRYQKEPKLRAYRYLCFCLLGLKMTIVFIFSHVGLTGCVVGYSILGGWIFKGLEAPYELELRRQAGEIREKYTRMIVKVSEEAFINGEENPGNVSADLIQEFEKEIVRFTGSTGWDGSEDEEEVVWSYSGALLYSVTVITTIGYGHIAPKTDWGRIITMIYAIFGIPLTILCLSIIGSSMATVFKFVYTNCCLGLYRQCRRFRAYLDSDGEIPVDAAAAAAAAAVPNALVAAGVAAAAAAEDATIGFSSEKQAITGSSEKTANFQNGPEVWDEHGTWPDGGDYRRNSSYMRSIPGRGDEECLERAYLAEIEHIDENGMAVKDQNKESDDVSPPNETEQEESLSENLNDEEVVTVPVLVSLLVFAAYIFLGAFLFSLWEKDWDYLVGSYFCFITLSTIGFGDVVPGSTGDSWASAKKQALCSIYLLFGMAMTIMCIKLMQQEVRSKFTNLGRRIGLIETDGEDERQRRKRGRKQKKVDEIVSECKNYDKPSSDDVINLQ